MGQAAGLAAVLSLDTDRAADDLEVSKLQTDLQQVGAVLEEPDMMADINRDGWINNFKHGAIS